MDEILYTLQCAQDIAIKEKKYNLNMYVYLSNSQVKRIRAREVLRSSVIKEMTQTMLDINLSLKNGITEDILYAKEAYGYLSKPEARKIISYYENIIDGIKRYIAEKKGGRKISQGKLRSGAKPK
jgi:hypothetical protein